SYRYHRRLSAPQTPSRDRSLALDVCDRHHPGARRPGRTFVCHREPALAALARPLERCGRTGGTAVETRAGLSKKRPARAGGRTADGAAVELSRAIRQGKPAGDDPGGGAVVFARPRNL